MIENVERQGDLFYVKLTGQITKGDVDYVTPMVEKIIVECKKVKFLVHFNKVTGYSLGGFFTDFMFYFKYMNIIKHIAIVGANEEQEKLIGNASKFFHCTTMCFSDYDLTEAKNWISQY